MMKDFAEFEPEFWTEDGLLVRLAVPSFGVLGHRVAGLVAAVAISALSITMVDSLSLRASRYAVATVDPAPLDSRVISEEHATRPDGDTVGPRYWTKIQELLRSLPRAAADGADDTDDETPI